MEKARVEQFHNKNQIVITTKDAFTFQSYESTIATVSRDGKEVLTLGADWDYSNTTRKHLYLFISEYAPYDVATAIEESKNKSETISQLIKAGKIKFDRSL